MAKKKQGRGTSPATRQNPSRDRTPDGARDQSASAPAQNESGQPGGGQGRRDAVGRSGVYPASGGQAPADAEVRDMSSWGQGSRGAEGYADSGGSELVPREGQLLGGLDVGPSGAPIADVPSDDKESQTHAPKRGGRTQEPDQ